jgi:hypothetical protein
VPITSAASCWNVVDSSIGPTSMWISNGIR